MPNYTNKELIEALLERDLDAYDNLKDILGLLRLYVQENSREACKISKIVRKHATKMSVSLNSVDFFRLTEAALLLESPYIFDSFLQYIEMDRPPNERFYLPRRKVLLRVVEALQKLADDELDVLFVSMPPRTGKSQLGIFYLAWLIGRDPNKTNLVSGYSDKLTRSFYDGIMEIMEDPVTYKFRDVFPGCKIINTNSKDETINFGRRTRYPTITCRSIEGSLTGNTEANNLLYGDDLVEGIESALSPVRMESLWSKVTNNLLSRRKKTCKLLFIGTRWSTNDPLGRLQTLFETDKEYRDFRQEIVVLPALGENGESNFDYDYGVGYSTTDFKRIRSLMSEPDWMAQYMQRPLDREGRLFPLEALNYFNGELPPAEPDRILLSVDVAYGGSDYLSAPLGFVYGRTVYVLEVVFSKEGIDITVPKLCALLSRYAPNNTRFEANNGGFLMADKVKEALAAAGIKRVITSRTTPSTSNKMTRILVAAPDVLENFYFLDEDHWSPEYREFMMQLSSFNTLGKNPNDDAPDSIAMLSDMATESPSVRVIKRPF